MNKRYDCLDKFREIQGNLLNKDESILVSIIKELEAYYLIKDLDEGTQCFSIFYTLYISKEILSYDKISSKFYISLATLYNYRKMFNRLAQKMIKVKQNIELNR